MNIILFDEGEKSFSRSDERYQHIKSVLRLGVGGVFKGGVFNGKRGSCTIVHFDDRRLNFTFTPEVEDAELYPVTVILAAVRPICMKRILRELVSMGVERIIITNSELGEKSYLSSGLYTTGEYLSIMKSGAMQSGHCGLSQAIFAPTLEEAVEALEPGCQRIVFDVDADYKSIRSLPVVAPVAIAIGGERGWTNRERAFFSIRDFIRVGLGDRILRSETATVAGTALTLSRLAIM